MRISFLPSLIFFALASLAPASGGYADDESRPRVWPNPVNIADKSLVNRLLHVDQVEPGSTLSIYNMIGEKIYNRALNGGAFPETWDLVNNNGVHVVTGVYVILIQAPSGKSSIHRIAILQ